MRVLTPPFSYQGGKVRLAGRIVNLIPEHKTYVEVFGGSGAVLFRKEPSPVEVFNDLHDGIVTLYRVIRSPYQFHKFLRLAELTPYSRSEYLKCRKTWRLCTDPVEKARRVFVTLRQGFGGRMGSGWGYAIKPNGRGGTGRQTAKYRSSVLRLPGIHERLLHVQIECLDFRKLIPKYDYEDAFFYCDPPYVHSTRKSGVYEFEMSDADHRELVELLLNLKGKAILSGYANELYKPLEDAGWKRLEFRAAASCMNARLYAGKPEMTRRTECLWLSPGIAVPGD